MSVPARQPASAGASKSVSPGRPKDLAKGAAILDAAKRMFTLHGYEGVSMDQIAAEAGVSKLTVYSHFGDKDALFAAAVKSHCEQQLPDTLFLDARPEMPLRERLMTIARAFFGMISSPEAIAGHRILCSPQITATALPALFWQSGPQRIQDGFAALLERRIASGELEIEDVGIAAAQFFTLVKGEAHARLVFGCGGDAHRGDVEAHLAASVDLFLRAYSTAPARARRA